jgi:hypothetical protein
LKASSKSYRNPKKHKSAENCETLGTNFQNAQNFTLRVSGGALEKVVLSYANIFLNFQFLGAETHKIRGLYKISGNLRRVVRLCKRGGKTGKRFYLVQWVLQNLCSETINNLQQPISQEETPCTSTQEVSSETLLNKGRKPIQILCYILQEKDLHHQENLAHKRVIANPRRLAPKRGVHFSQEGVLAKISKLTQTI